MVNEAEGNYTRSYRPSTTLPVLMRKVYTWMALALVITGVTAYGVATTPSIIEAIVFNKLLFYGLIAAEFGLVWFLSSRIVIGILRLVSIGDLRSLLMPRMLSSLRFLWFL